MKILLTSLLFSITLFFSNRLVLVCGQCDSHQQSLLLQLKKHLVFNSNLSTKLVKWNQGENSWDGVTCEEGRVTGLDLSSESISAGVEDSSPLFSFRYLKTLNLAFNQFNGSQISSRFGNLTNLNYLDLSTADFEGQIPDGISQLTSLIILDLSGNYKLELPNLAMLVQNLTSLEDLHLDYVNISAHGNEWGKALSPALLNLRVLGLSWCGLSGPIDSSLAQLEYLSVIRMSGNYLYGPIPNFFANFSNLTCLDLSYCLFHENFPQQIFQVSTLEILDLSDNLMLHGSLPEFSQNLSLQALVLSNTSFSGILPESIGKLKMLTSMDLSYCNFSGPIPNSMSNLTRLRNLDVSYNSFTGPISSFSASRNLMYLQTAHNVFSGSISLMSSSSLYTLDLSSNMFQGKFPKFIFTLQGLLLLDLSLNNFSDIVQIDMFRQLRNLSYLDLSYNSLSINVNGTDSTLPFPQFNSLNLAFCKLGSFPDFLKSQSRLYTLDLSNNQIHGEIPKWIWRLPNLSSLNLSHNFLTNAEGPIQNNSSLLLVDLHSNMLQGPIPIFSEHATYLDYSHNNLSSAIPIDIGNYLTQINFFSLSNNKLHGGIPYSICNMEFLQVLDLSNNNLSGIIPRCLTTLTSLGVLNLRKNNFNGNISDTFGNCNLQTFDVSGNMIEGKLPKSLANCMGMEVLDFGNNNIHDTFPCYLRNISSLRVFVLRSNKFNGYINCSGYDDSWPRLQIVDLASNNFSGELSEKFLGSWKVMMVGEDKAEQKLKHIQYEVLRFSQRYYDNTVTVISKGMQFELVKILTIFTSIDLSSNNFHGSIPEVMGEFKSLYILNLSHNSLTGQIPSSLGNMEDIESLDLSRNRLNGEIPVQLASLNFLSVLDLSFNQLVGRIPTGSQLQTFSEAAFQGNAGLYGCPLTDNCTKTKEAELSPGTSEDSENGINWELVCTEIGFIVSFGIVILPLMFWKRWRYRYYKHVDRILFRIFPQLNARSRNHGRRVQTKFLRQRL